MSLAEPQPQELCAWRLQKTDMTWQKFQKPLWYLLSAKNLEMSSDLLLKQLTFIYAVHCNNMLSKMASRRPEILKIMPVKTEREAFMSFKIQFPLSYLLQWFYPSIKHQILEHPLIYAGTSSQSPSLHNQPSELLHATLQQNDCTSSGLHITLWPWVSIKVIQTGIKLKNLVLSSIIPRLKQIRSQVSWHTTILNMYIIISTQFSPLNIACAK